MQEDALLTSGLRHCQNDTLSPGSDPQIVSSEDFSLMENSAPIPSVVAMLVCDQVITEQGSNKKSLIGVFELFQALAFPTIIPRIAIYVKLADAFGKYDFKLRLVKLKDESLVAEIGLEANVTDSDHYSELALNIGNFPLPDHGKYEFQLYAGDVYLHRVTMHAYEVQLPPGGQSWPPKPKS